MKRLAQFAAATTIVALSILVPTAPVLAAAPGAARSAAAGVDDFSFQSFDADYYLGTDESGRSTLTTVETFVALFPETDQNHGMKRAIPLNYQNAPTDVSVTSVTDGAGNPRPYTVETDDDTDALDVISREDGFVHGAQTYVFTYTQHNVTRYFQNTDDDEFYWDTNGTDWAQSFGVVTARVHVPAALAASLTGSASCYRGSEGATDACQIDTQREDAGTVFTASASELGAGQNLTVAIGFAPHTFVPRDDSYLGSPIGLLQLLSLVVSVIAAIWALILRRTTLADGRGRPTIIAEYQPPRGIGPVTAAVLLQKTLRATAAGIIDLAVTRKIRIVETEPEGFFSRKPGYQLELIDGSGITGPERELAAALFGESLTPGSSYLMTKSDTGLSQRVRAIVAAATVATTADGLRKKNTFVAALLPTAFALVGVVGSILFGFSLISDSRGGVLPAILFVPAVVAAAITFRVATRRVLTDRGAEVRDHLKGLELYIRLAEADRLRVLQSPTGAERSAVSADDPRQVLHIYEKLLPYAVIFGLEKEWAEVLGTYYLDSAPDWYYGPGVFNAAVFASSISSISSTVAASYSGSSSSGGSGGGGSSGGGGGGGGGGGV